MESIKRNKSDISCNDTVIHNEYIMAVYILETASKIAGSKT
jgi:hypothetical protein